MGLAIFEWAEIGVALICTVCYLYKPSTNNRWFILFLWLTIAVELTGRFTNDYPVFKVAMYNLFNIVQFGFYTLYFFSITQSDGKRFFIKFLSISLLIFSVYNLLFLQGVRTYNNKTSVVGSSMMMLFCLLQYFEIIKSDSPKHFKWAGLFIVSGIFIFYVGTFSIYVSFAYLIKNMSKEMVWLYKLVVGNLSVILYSMYSAGFIFEVIEAPSKKKVP